jgi:hypothetical protein
MRILRRARSLPDHAGRSARPVRPTRTYRTRTARSSPPGWPGNRGAGAERHRGRGYAPCGLRAGGEKFLEKVRKNLLVTRRVVPHTCEGRGTDGHPDWRRSGGTSGARAGTQRGAGRTPGLEQRGGSSPGPAGREAEGDAGRPLGGGGPESANRRGGARHAGRPPGGGGPESANGRRGTRHAGRNVSPEATGKRSSTPARARRGFGASQGRRRGKRPSGTRTDGPYDALRGRCRAGAGLRLNQGQRRGRRRSP